MNQVTPDHPHWLSDSDLRLVNILQDSPRAPWASVARVLGASAPTARRRWRSITDEGAAWIASYPGFTWGLLCAIVEVRCRPGSVDEVAASLRRSPRIVTVTGLTGDRDLVLTVLTRNMTEFRRLLQNELGRGTDIIGVRSSIVSRMFSEGSRWRALGAPGGARGLDTTEAQLGNEEPISLAQWRAVLPVLERNGRASAAELATALGSSDGHARRVVNRLLRNGWIQQRVDLSLEQNHWPHALALWMVVPAARLEDTAASIAKLSMTRLCAGLAGGTSNLYVIVWLRDLPEAASIEAQLVRSLDVRVTDRAILLHYYKRVGHLFDDNRAHEGFVSWLLPEELEPAAPGSLS
ncbi:MAG: Lrp/AsnC family transcriptional regulator [Mycetocola reblochoni]|uniref:AsnC family transcriptional regulator n=1 Tax=Mycetocola reblochoni TaxID=331618 RepID=A0A3L6ZT35_9MICO|nr:Lrp/AsnC ligand binding domain-containing protein [Mycetocola reblochoni]RLP71090.1 AsnC family transcriptional regulator [Mycetocola reblochoni]